MFWMRSPSQRIFGEASEKNLYLSQLIILDTLEKCLAGVSSVLQTPPHHPKKKTADQASTFKYLEIRYWCSATHNPLVMYLPAINQGPALLEFLLRSSRPPDYICRHLVGEPQPMAAGQSPSKASFLSAFVF